MTLVLAGAIGGKCAITTADTRRTHGVYWENEETGMWGELYDTRIPTKKVVNKVNKLTNFVTYATSGNSEISRHVIKRLKKVVSSDDGVLITGLKLQEVINEMREQISSGEDVPFYYKFLDEHDKFGILLNGFTNEIFKGKSFFCFYISGFDKRVHADEIKDGEYKYILWGPSEELATRKEEYMNVEFKKDENNSKSIINHYLKMHAVVNHLLPEFVSELCDYHLLEWKNHLIKPKLKSEQINVLRHYKELVALK